MSQLTPAPWQAVYHGMVNPAKPWRLADADGDTIAFFVSESDAKQCALARNAFDIQMRRGWGVAQLGKEWIVTIDDSGSGLLTGRCVIELYPDPFTALIEADKWLESIENVTPQPPSPSQT